MENAQEQSKNQNYRNLSKKEIKRKKFINDAKSAFKYTLHKTVKRLMILTIIIIVFLLFCSFAYYTLLLQSDIVPQEILKYVRTLL